MNDRAYAVLRRATLFENGRHLIAVGEAHRCSRGIHEELFGDIAGNGFFILQEELLELKDIAERIALRGYPGSVDFTPDEVNKLVAASPHAFDAHGPIAQ